jgi:sugar phosphate permease
MIVGAVCYAMMSGFYLWLPIYLQQWRHFSVLHAGGSISMFGLAGIIGVILGALLSDRLIAGGMPVLAARRMVVVGSILFAGSAILCTAIFQSNLAMLVTITVGSFAMGLGTASAWALVPAVVPNAKLIASLGSLQNGAWQLGGAIAPLAIGALLDRGFNFHIILAFSAAFALLSALIYGFVLRTPMQKLADPEVISSASGLA